MMSVSSSALKIQENDICIDWIHDDTAKGAVRRGPRTSKKPASQPGTATVPVPDLLAVTKTMTEVDTDIMTRYSENMRRLIITARKQVKALEERNQKLEEQVASDSVVRCPSCLFLHKVKENRFLPTFIKAYPGRFSLELTFKSKEELLSFMAASQLEADENGIPVIATAPKAPPKSLFEAGSTISKLVEETKRAERLKISLAPSCPVTTSDDNERAVMPVVQPEKAEQVASEKVVLRRSPRKLAPTAKGGQSAERALSTSISSRKMQEKTVSGQGTAKRTPNCVPIPSPSSSSSCRQDKPGKAVADDRRPSGSKTAFLEREDGELDDEAVSSKSRKRRAAETKDLTDYERPKRSSQRVDRSPVKRRDDGTERDGHRDRRREYRSSRNLRISSDHARDTGRRRELSRRGHSTERGDRRPTERSTEERKKTRSFERETERQVYRREEQPKQQSVSKSPGQPSSPFTSCTPTAAKEEEAPHPQVPPAVTMSEIEDELEMVDDEEEFIIIDDTEIASSSQSVRDDNLREGSPPEAEHIDRRSEDPEAEFGEVVEEDEAVLGDEYASDSEDDFY